MHSGGGLVGQDAGAIFTTQIIFWRGFEPLFVTETSLDALFVVAFVLLFVAPPPLFPPELRVQTDRVI